jgi:hypothetical protein
MRYLLQTIALASMVSVAYADDQPQGIRFGPFIRSEVVNGVNVTVPYSATVNHVAAPEGLRIDVTVVADLGDVATKMGMILGAIPFPNDNCHTYSPTNPVVSLEKSNLAYQSGQAVLGLAGTVVVWACVQNPIHKTKIDMQIKSIGFGIKTKIPVVVDMGLGDPIKTIVGSQPFQAALPIDLVVHDAQSVELKLGSPTVNLGGQYASISEGVLSLAGIDINQQAGEALRHAINLDALRQTLPPVAGLQSHLSDARFIETAGHLGAEIRFSAAVTEADGLRLFQALLAAIQNGLPN